MAKHIGIYKITNKANVLVYIGQSQDIYSRWRTERCGHVNAHMKSDMDTYGIDNFEFIILEEISNRADNLVCILDEKEKQYISEYNSADPLYGYNKTFGGDKECVFTQEYKNARSIMYSGEGNPQYGRKGELNARYGAKLTAEQANNISKALKGKKKSEEHCLHISLARKGKHLNISETRLQQLKQQMSAKVGKLNPTARAVMCLETAVVYDCITDAEIAMKGILSRSSIKKSLKDGKVAKGYTWKYVNDNK